MLGDNIKFTHTLCWEINESLHINYAGRRKKVYSITIQWDKRKFTHKLRRGTKEGLHINYAGR